MAKNNDFEDSSSLGFIHQLMTAGPDVGDVPSKSSTPTSEKAVAPSENARASCEGDATVTGVEEENGNSKPVQEMEFMPSYIEVDGKRYKLAGQYEETKKSRVSLNLKPSIHKRLKEKAVELGLNVNCIIEGLIVKYLENCK